MELPGIVAHADWSVNDKKRVIAKAVHAGGGLYHAGCPENVGNPAALLKSLAEEAKGEGVLVGFDFLIGLPDHYARQAGINHFLDFLSLAGREKWAAFFDVAVDAEEISLYRPFYPQRSQKGLKQKDLLFALKAASFDELRRVCERKRIGLAAASPLFWTLGAKQVGKAAIHGWRNVIIPALQDPDLQVKLWPFAGDLDTLLEDGCVVVAETYPAEFYTHMNIRFPGARRGEKHGKRVQADRRGNAATILGFAEGLGLCMDEKLLALIKDGFGPAADGEDAFDAVAGLLGMLNVVLHCNADVPEDKSVRDIEGWILGRAP